MIDCETVSRKDKFEPEEFLKLRNVIRELFPTVSKQAEIKYFSDDCYFYKLSGADEKRNVMLMSHHDVVAAEGEWKYPPFAGKIAEDCIWGRGTVDTKTPLFAEFSALDELLKRLIPTLNVQAGSMLGTTCSFRNLQITQEGDCTAEVFSDVSRKKI